MKTFSFIVPLILSILCLLYLLFYPCQSTPTEYDFSAKVLAKEKEHNTISNALFLTTGSACKEKLEAHEQCYYYVSQQKNITFSISSHSIQSLKTDLLSDTGKRISYQIQKKNHTLLLTPSSKKADSERIFLCLTNQSVSDCTIKIQITTVNTVTPKPNKSTASNSNTATSKPNKSTASNPNIVTPKSNKSTISNPNTVTPKSSKSTASNPNTVTPKPSKSTASNPNTITPKPSKSTASNPNIVTPKPNKSTASNPNTVTPKPSKSTASNPNTVTPKPSKSTASNPNTVTSKPDNILSKDFKKAILQPQFLLLPPDTSKKITITNYTQKNTIKQFTWLSTNSNVATVKNGIIITHQEGTAIIYLRDKEITNNTSSCLIRVLNMP